MDLEKLLVNDKIKTLRQTNMSPKDYIKYLKKQKWTLKTVRLTSFQKPRTAIRFNLLHVCPTVLPVVLILLCYSCRLIMFWTVIFMFHSVQWQFQLFEFRWISWYRSLNMIFMATWLVLGIASTSPLTSFPERDWLLLWLLADEGLELVVYCVSQSCLKYGTGSWLISAILWWKLSSSRRPLDANRPVHDTYGLHT